MSDRKRSSSEMAEGGHASSSKSGRNDASNPSSDPSSQGQPARRTRRLDIETSKRGNRMFGLLNSTLTKAKEENEKRNKGEAGRRRAQVEARLQQKLQDEKRLEELSKRLKPLVRQLYEIAIEIESKESAIRLRKAQKRRLASFLITTSELSTYDGKIAKETSIDGKVLAPDVALAFAPIGPRHPQTLKRPDSHPIYFLPKKNLTAQDDRLDEQEDRVDDEIDEADEAWRSEKEKLQNNMLTLKEEILAIKSEMNRIDAGEVEGSATGKNEKADAEMQEAKVAEKEEDKMMEDMKDADTQ